MQVMKTCDASSAATHRSKPVEFLLSQIYPPAEAEWGENTVKFLLLQIRGE